MQIFLQVLLVRRANFLFFFSFPFLVFVTGPPGLKANVLSVALSSFSFFPSFSFSPPSFSF